MLSSMPRDATFRASVTRVKSGYFFSFKVHSAVGSFEAETMLFEATADRTARDWQAVALADLERALERKLKKWMKRHELEPSFAVQGYADFDEYDALIRKAG
ncbi:MAG TPA: hypothetical protein VFV50_00680 [Bdellovibrionales bacterium]|nr:hypothetical protein [Bdellovibrionales bacterium]